MRILKTHPLAGLLNSYLIDVRCEMVVFVIAIIGHNSYYFMTSVELDEMEIKSLNIASLSKGLTVPNLVRDGLGQEVSPMVKAILLKDESLMFPQVGMQHAINGLYWPHKILNR
jgi:hypothetical protein